MTKYEPFRRHLAGIPPSVQELALRFPDIERILGAPLPPSARRHAVWWSNDPSHPLMRVILGAGWRRSRVDLPGETVQLVRGKAFKSSAQPSPPTPPEPLRTDRSSGQKDAPPLTPLGELVRSHVWDDFAAIVRVRFARFASRAYDYSLSEENFRIDFAVALARRVDYPHRVFAEYPCDRLPSQKLDLFVDDGPGLCFEFKFFRPIPSAGTQPMTQHLGSLWADLFKLAVLCDPRRLKFLIVFADARFRSYFAGQAVFPADEGVAWDRTFIRDEQPKTVLETLAKRLPRVEIPARISMSLENVRTLAEDPFHAYLFRVA